MVDTEQRNLATRGLAGGNSESMAFATTESRPLLIIRADANAEIGWGHAVRMAALAQAWNAGGGSVAWCTSGVPERIANWCGGDVTWLEPDGIHREASRAAWIALDGYRFDDDYQRALAVHGTLLLVMDDAGHARHSCADLIVRQAHSNIDDLLQTAPNAEILAGLRYALIRREVTEHAKWSLDQAAHQRVVVTCGGSDTANATCRVVRSLTERPVANLRRLEIVVGSDFAHRPMLDQLLTPWNGGWTIHENSDCLPAILSNASLVITAGGCTMLECLCLGCPTVALATANNQVPGCRELAAQQAVVYLGLQAELTSARTCALIESLLKAPQRLAKLSLAGQNMVDGLGSRRIVKRLRIGKVHLRPAGPNDCFSLFQLRNDPLVVAASLTSSPVSWDEHCHWFQSANFQSSRRLQVITNERGEFLGQVRLDWEDSHRQATISISLVAAARGIGLGSRVVRLALANAVSEPRLERVVAWIKPDNAASLSAFRHAGFVQYDDIGDSPLRLHWDRPQYSLLPMSR